MVTPLGDIEDAIADAIEALATDHHTQGTATVATWRRNPRPFTASADTRLRAHLAYSVSVEEIDAQADAGSSPFGPVAAVGQLAVVWYYRIRPQDTHALTDVRGAQRSAFEVAAAVARPRPGFAVWPVALWRPGPIEAGEWLPLQARFGLMFDWNLSPEYP